MGKCESSDERNFKEQLEMSTLRTSWAQLPTLERVERLRAFIDKRFSRRASARGVGCSESLVRQLLKLENLTTEERQAVREGSLSGKQALKKVQERKVRERQERLRVSEEEWTKEVERQVKVELHWFNGLEVNKPCLEQIIPELGGGRCNIRLAEFAQHAPKPWQIPTGKDPEAVIKACRPKGDTQAMSGPEFSNYCFTWYARWSQRVMPDRKLRDTVLAIVAHRLL